MPNKTVSFNAGINEVLKPLRHFGILEKGQTHTITESLSHPKKPTLAPIFTIKSEVRT